MAHFIHSCAKVIWRQLPVDVRRSAFRRAVDALAPSLSGAQANIKSDLRLPKIIVGFLSRPTGLGQSARLAAAAFRNQGFSVFGIDVSGFFFGRPGFLPLDLPSGRNHRGPAHVIVVVNAPYTKYVLALLGRSFLRDKFVTGYWVWEQPCVPKNWDLGFHYVHEVMSPSHFSATAIKALRPHAKVGVAAHPVVLDRPPRRRARPKQSPFTIVSAANVGSGFIRKNPLGLIRAFRLAFGNSKDAQLKLIVTGSENYPLARALILEAVRNCTNIVVHGTPLSRCDFYRWWSDADVFASLHRSEGFGLNIAEAMSAGYPVVATGWSGNMDYMTTENSFPLQYRLVEVDDPQNLYCARQGMWAEPDCEHAAQLFLNLSKEPALAATVGDAAQRSTPKRLNAVEFVHSMLYA